MSRIALVVLSAVALFAADDPWAKVTALPNRSELRIYQKGARDPITATLADATDERISGEEQADDDCERRRSGVRVPGHPPSFKTSSSCPSICRWLSQICSLLVSTSMI